MGTALALGRGAQPAPRLSCAAFEVFDHWLLEGCVEAPCGQVPMLALEQADEQLSKFQLSHGASRGALRRPLWSVLRFVMAGSVRLGRNLWCRRRTSHSRQSPRPFGRCRTRTYPGVYRMGRCSTQDAESSRPRRRSGRPAPAAPVEQTETAISVWCQRTDTTHSVYRMISADRTPRQMSSSGYWDPDHCCSPRGPTGRVSTTARYFAFSSI